MEEEVGGELVMETGGVEAGAPMRPQCKMKSYLMERFFNEPVEALDERLESAESNFNSLPMDPFTVVKQEELEEGEHPLDYSEVQVASPTSSHHVAAESHSPKQSPLNPATSSSPVQRVTIQTSSGSPPPGWARISPVPWRALLAPEELSPSQSPPPQRPSVIGPNPRWSTEPPAKRFKASPVDYNEDQIDSRILATEASAGFPGNPLSSTSLPQLDQMRPLQAQGYLDRYRQLAMEEVPKRTSSVIVRRQSKGGPTSPQERESSSRQGKDGSLWEEARKHGQDAEERLRQPSEQEIQDRLRQGTERMRFAMRGRNLPGEQPRHPLAQERSNVCDRLYPDGSGSLGAYDRLHQGVQERLREQDHSHLERPESHQRGQRTSGSHEPRTIGGHPSILENIHCGPERLQGKFTDQKRLSPGAGADGGGFIPRPEPPIDRQWLSHLQQLRAGFAYRMMEAQQRPPASWPPPPPPFPPQHLFHRAAAAGLPHQHPRPLERFPGGGEHHQPRPSSSSQPSSTITSQQDSPPTRPGSPASPSTSLPTSSSNQGDMMPAATKGKRGRPRKHAPKLPLPPLYVFIR